MVSLFLSFSPYFVRVGLNYNDLLDYDRTPVNTNIGTFPQREVVEGDHELLSQEIVISRELQGDVERHHVEEFNEENKDPYRRFEEYVLDTDQDIFYSDDHHHALSAWLAAYNEDDISEDSVLLHVDAHPDYEKPEPFHPPQNAEESIRRIAGDLKVNEFVYPAEQWGIFSDVRNWGVDDQSISGLSRPENHDFVFDLDLDVFGKLEEQVQVSDARFEDYYEIFADLMRAAEFTTIATSPGYIFQDEAIDHLDELMKVYDRKSS